MSSQTEIANMALAHFGQSRITDINQQSAPAQAIRDFWDNARKSTLRAASWNFAVTMAELTASITDPPFKWAKQYPLPSDYLHMVEVNCRLSGTSVTDHEIQGGMLLTNSAVAKIIYVRDVPLTGTWPEDFCLAFSFKLAGMVAPRLLADGGNAAVLMMQQHFEASLQALGNDKTESKPEVVNALSGSAYQAARVYGSDWYPYPLPPGLTAVYDVQFNPWNVPAP